MNRLFLPAAPVGAGPHIAALHSKTRGLVLLLAILAVAFQSHARAAVFSRDWKMPGDGLLTFDDVNQREWLDLSLTSLSQFPGSTQEARVQSVLGHLLPGGALQGFQLSSGLDASALAQSAGIHTSTDDFSINSVPTSALIQLMRPTRLFMDGRSFSVGFLSEREANPPMRRFGAVFQIDSYSGLLGQAGFTVSSSNDSRLWSETGVMLFRNVPEPSGLLLALLCLLARRRVR